MTYAPATLTALARYWVTQGGVNLGVVGDAAHGAKGVSYHLGRDQLVAGAYSAQTARDRAGLSNAASALDLGKLGGSLAKLRVFSKWLVAECQRGACPDIREVIYSPDGKTVGRWESSDNQVRTGPGQGDNSHLTHTHISFYRDSERRAQVGIFARYFTAANDPSPSPTPEPKPPATPTQLVDALIDYAQRVVKDASEHNRAALARNRELLIGRLTTT